MRLAYPVEEHVVDLVEALLRTSADVVAVIDEDGTYRRSNAAHARGLLRQETDSVAGAHVADFYSREIVAASVARGRDLLREQRPLVQYKMLRGMHARNEILPLPRSPWGPALLVRCRLADPTAHALRVAQGLTDAVEAERFPIADLGPLEGLSRDDLSLLRGLAAGVTEQELMDATGLSAFELDRWSQRVGASVGWPGTLRSLRSHAYASGLHMFEDAHWRASVD